MPISGTTTDYSNRLVDMYISGSLNPNLSGVPQTITYSFGTTSQYCAGVQKLIQRYLISLSNSGFIEQLLGSTNSNISKATHIFNLSSMTVVQTFKAYQNANPSTNEDEQLAAVQLTSVTTNASDSTVPVGHINFTANLVTLAGTTIPFTLPLPLV